MRNRLPHIPASVLGLFQVGGEVVQGDPNGGQDPMTQIIAMAEQALASQDPEMAMGVCQALLELAQGGGQPPVEQAPAPAPQMA